MRGAAAAASRAAELRADARWVRLARWFADQPGERAVYSIHNIVQLGLLYDKLPGEWYGPSSAARVLRDLARMHRHVGARAERAARETAADAEAPTPADDDDDEFAGALEVYLPASEIIYASEVHRLCAGPATPSPPSAEGDDDPLHLAAAASVGIRVAARRHPVEERGARARAAAPRSR